MMKTKRKILPGDLLWVDRGLYHHCGIYEGEGQVIHFAASKGSEINPESAVIHRTTFERFKKGYPVRVIDIDDSFPPDETLRRARSRIGEKGYDLATNNCDHFAIWCKTGEHRSIQVEEVKNVLKAIGTASRKVDEKIGGSVDSLMGIICQIHEIAEDFKASNLIKPSPIERK